MQKSKARPIETGKRPYSGVQRIKQISENSQGRSAFISEDRTDPFTESGNFDRDTQDDFVAREFDKVSLFTKKAEPAAAPLTAVPETIYEQI